MQTEGMFVSRKPSLRHFAVMRRVFHGFSGSLWKVQDRRDPLKQQHLFVPSRANAWPLWISRLHSLSPTPTRLRNGKVAIVLTIHDLSSFIDSIRAAKKAPVVSLNAISGFESVARKSRLGLILVPVLALSLISLLLLPKDQSGAAQSLATVQEKQINNPCTQEVQPGAQIVGSLTRFGKITIAGSEYKIASFNMFGGLALITIKRSCDKKYLRVEAWFDGELLRLSKVY